MTVEISVVVCTYNRCSFLQRFLYSFNNLNVIDEIPWELIIVDNNSCDDTRAFVTRRQDYCTNLRYLFEGRQGKGYALNTGIDNARGNVIIFTDDDVALCDDWLLEYNKAFKNQPQYHWFGGVVRPQWSNGEPRWLSDSPNRDYFKGYFVWYEIAPESRPYEPRDTLPYGASMAIRKNVFKEVGKFREDIGVRGKIRGAGMDIDMIGRAQKHGFNGYYVNTAVCLHYVDERRLRIGSFYTYGVGRGVNHHKIEEVKKSGSIVRAIGQLIRGIVQLIRGRGDNFRITIINAGMESGRLLAKFARKAES